MLLECRYKDAIKVPQPLVLELLIDGLPHMEHDHLLVIEGARVEIALRKPYTLPERIKGFCWHHLVTEQHDIETGELL